MKKRSAVRLACYCLAALLVMGAFALRAQSRAAALRRYVEAGWQRSFAALSADLVQIDTALKKCLYSSSPALCGSACAEVYARAQEAQSSLGELPFSDYLLENTAGFLGRLGDYARALSLAAYRGGLDTQQRRALQELGHTAEELNGQLIALQSQLDQGLLQLDESEEQEALLEEQAPSLGSSLRSVEDEFPELPSLIYDGPYSQSVERAVPRMLEGLEKVSEEDALAAAAAFLGRERSAFEVIGRSEGKLPCYLIRCGEGGEEGSLRVTVQGGRVLDYVSAAGGLYRELTPEEGLEKAHAFLRQLGYRDLQDSYWVLEEGTMLLNFAATQDGTVCYPDLVKLRIAMDSGQVVGYDAEGYLMNHCRRSLPPAVPAEEAAYQPAPGLTVLARQTALIPMEGGGERLCHELKCEDESGRHVIIYVDAVTGEEAKVLLLLEDENGTLTM